MQSVANVWLIITLNLIHNNWFTDGPMKQDGLINIF